MFGSSPRCRMKTRFGLSAKTLCPAPHVHFSLPGKLEMGFGQFGTMSCAENVLAAFLARNRRESDFLSRLSLQSRPPVAEQNRHQHDSGDRGHNDQTALVH